MCRLSAVTEVFLIVEGQRNPQGEPGESILQPPLFLLPSLLSSLGPALTRSKRRDSCRSCSQRAKSIPSNAAELGKVGQGKQREAVSILILTLWTLHGFCFLSVPTTHWRPLARKLCFLGDLPLSLFSHNHQVLPILSKAPPLSGLFGFRCSCKAKTYDLTAGPLLPTVYHAAFELCWL